MIQLSRFLFVVLGLAFATSALAEDHKEVRHFSTKSGLHFYVGGEVDVTEAAETAFAAGGTVKVSGQDLGEIIAAGGTVDIPDTKTGRIIAAGGAVDITNTTVARTVIASGGAVEVKGSKVAGDVILSGADVSFAGEVGGDVIATGGEITLAGQFGGDVTLRGGEVKLDPATRIAGNLTYAARDELVVPAGMVSGRVIREDFTGEGGLFGDFDFGKLLLVAVLTFVGMLVGLFVFAAVVLAVVGNLVNSAARSVTERPAEALGIGVLVAVVVPVTILVLVITIIGIPLGLFTLAAYGVLFGLGIIVAAYWMGMKTRDAIGYNDEGDAGPPPYLTALGWTLAGLVMFTVMGMIPFVGNLAQFFALVTGFGAFILAVTGNRKQVLPAA